MIRFFTSVKTAILFYSLIIFFFFAGTLIIPKTMELYTGIIDTVLFTWLGQESLTASWWILGIIAAMALLAVNTFVCSADVLLTKLTRTALLRTLAPQVVHLGVLLILLGHFLTSGAGLRTEAVLHEGSTLPVFGETSFRVESITVEPSELTSVRWRVEGVWLKEDEPAKQAVIEPGRPSFYRWNWVFIESADSSPLRTVLLVRRDPGLYAFLSGVGVFALGCAMVVLVRRPREEQAP
jgi:hypothetical protein